MTWKDHPLAVAATTFTATMVLVFAYIPVSDRLKENEIADQKAQVRKLEEQVRKLEEEAKTLRTTLEESQLAAVDLRRRLDKLSPDGIFSVDDVYPKGFRAVRIGDRIEMLEKAYGSTADIKDEEGWITVRPKKKELFHRLAYYYNDNAKVKTVTSILFFFNSDDLPRIKSQLVEKYGIKTMKEITKRGKTQLVWSDINKHTLELGDVTFRISRR